MQKNQGLPQGWVWATIGELAKTSSGGTPSRSNPNYFTGTIPWIKSGELGDCYVKQCEEFITEEAVENSSAKLFPKGTLLVALYGATVGKAGILSMDATTNQAICGIFLPESVELQYAFNYLLSIRKALIDQGKGGAQPNISQDIIRNTPFPLPPLPEQRRIVAKLEELLSRWEAGVAALRQTQAQLRRYRQAVLHAAVTGELTRAWREAQPASAETGAALLARIRQQRRAQWEATQVAKRGGQLPLGDNWKKKYEEPAAPDTSELPELPQGWVWASFSQLGNWTGGGTPSKANAAFWENGNVLWISPKDIKQLRLSDSEDKITELAVEDSTAKFIPPNSLLFVIRSGILRRVLPVALLEVEGTVNQDIKALTPFIPELATYLLYVAQGLNNEIRTSCMKSGTTVESIEVGQLQEYIVPLPPLAEQAQIVAEVERRLSVLDALEATLRAELTRAERLRQSLLHRAFTGRLVPQDAADEPAAALLARLAAAPAPGGRGRGRKGGATGAGQGALGL